MIKKGNGIFFNKKEKEQCFNLYLMGYTYDKLSKRFGVCRERCRQIILSFQQRIEYLCGFSGLPFISPYDKFGNIDRIRDMMDEEHTNNYNRGKMLIKTYGPGFVGAGKP